MTIYIYLFIIATILSFFKKNKFLLFIIYLLLLSIGSLRSIDVGTDTENYENMYKIINSGEEGRLFILAFVEPGWVLINYICGHIFDNYRPILFIGVFLSITPFFMRLWKSYDCPFHAIFFYITLYFYYNSFNITRQMVAISIILFCFDYLRNKQYKKYIIGILCAMLFHYSAIFCLCHIWIIKRIKITTINALLILSSTYLMGLYVIPLLIPHIPLVGHYSAYLMDTTSSGSATRILLNAFFIFILVSCDKRKIEPYLNLFFVGIVIYNLFAFSSAVGRLALYFTCTQLFLYPMMTSRYVVNSFTLKLCSFIYASTYYFLMLNANSGEIVPYQIWE